VCKTPALVAAAAGGATASGLNEGHEGIDDAHDADARARTLTSVRCDPTRSHHIEGHESSNEVDFRAALDAVHSAPQPQRVGTHVEYAGRSARCWQGFTCVIANTINLNRAPRPLDTSIHLKLLRLKMENGTWMGLWLRATRYGERGG